MAKNFFILPGIVFFLGQKPREVNEFVSNTVVFSVVSPLRTLGIQHVIFLLAMLVFLLQLTSANQNV
jgi:hypothetical protein